MCAKTTLAVFVHEVICTFANPQDRLPNAARACKAHDKRDKIQVAFVSIALALNVQPLLYC